MSLLRPVSFCHQCKKVIASVEDLLFVEDKVDFGFCSEPCIENFYHTLVDYYEKNEAEWRKAHKLADEDILEVIGDPVFMDQVLSTPDEVWLCHDELGKERYSFIKKIEDRKWGEFYLCVLAFVFDKRASFIISVTATRSEELINEFKYGELQKEFEVNQADEQLINEKEVSVDEKTLMNIENKKSEFLALMLEERSANDIPFENFYLYDQFFEETMQGPDEIYQYLDDQKDSILTYIKALSQNGTSFFYFIVCLKVESNEAKQQDVLVPIISFPTIDGHITKLYKKGELVSGSLKN